LFQVIFVSPSSKCNLSCFYAARYSYGYAILFLAVAAEQIGLPLPSSPLLFAAGALAGLHLLNPAIILSTALAASLLSDSAWYVLGRRRGHSILGHACRISLEPETCVSRMHEVYHRYGAKSLLFCKFVPELGTLGPPMAGMMGVPPARFLLLDAGGALLWSGAFVAVGWAFRTQLEVIGLEMTRLGTWLAIAIASGIVTYVTWKYIERRRFYKSLRVARITPYELKHLLDTRESLVIFDLRNPVQWREGRIPGSVQLDQEEVVSLVPSKTNEEVILYCSCPKEADSARAALRLKRRGVGHVRPLEGGFERWQELGFPVEESGQLKNV
jgi:membrane protein DedA with SNARE-associated domain/rhodanese-related sulfurtransferase